MGLREQFEKYNIITDEDIARGIVYAWTLMVVADAKVEQVELKALEEFVKTHDATQRFNKNDWLSDGVGEALNVYRTEGEDALYAVIKEMLDNTGKETKRRLLFSLMELACVDGDFDNRELDVLHRIVTSLQIELKDAIMMGMLFATQQSPILLD